MGLHQADLVDAPIRHGLADGLVALHAREREDDGGNHTVTLRDALDRADRGLGEQRGPIGCPVMAPVGGDGLPRCGRRAEGESDDEKER